MRRLLHCFSLIATLWIVSSPYGAAQDIVIPPPPGSEGCQFPLEIKLDQPTHVNGFEVQALQDGPNHLLLSISNYSRLTGSFRVVGFEYTGIYVPGQVPKPGSGVEHLLETGDVSYPGVASKVKTQMVRVPVDRFHQISVDVWTFVSTPDLLERMLASEDDPQVWVQALLAHAEAAYWADLTEKARDEIVARLDVTNRLMFLKALDILTSNVGELFLEREETSPYVTSFNVAIIRPYCIRIEGVATDRVYDTDETVTAQATAYDWMRQDVTRHLSWSWSYGGTRLGQERALSLTTRAGTLPLVARAVNPKNDAYDGAATVNVTATDQGEEASSPPNAGHFSGIYTTSLPASFEVALGVYARLSSDGKPPAITIGNFESRIFVKDLKLTFFEDGSGLAQGGSGNPLQIWSGIPGMATFAWERLDNRNIRVRFVSRSRDVTGGQPDVLRLQIEFEEREGLLYPVDFFVMKVTTSSYVQFNVEQAQNPFFSVERDCPGAWQGQSIHLYKDLPKRDPFAQMAYVRTSATVSDEARAAAKRVNGMPYMIPPAEIDRFFEEPALMCAGEPGVVR